MTGLLLDTHVWAWTLRESFRIPASSLQRIAEAPTVRVSSVSFYEIGQKVRLGKWPEMSALVDTLASRLNTQGARVAAVTADIAQRAAALDWAHRDPFDRLIAATSIFFDAPLISADIRFDDLQSRPDWPGRHW